MAKNKRDNPKGSKVGIGVAIAVLLLGAVIIVYQLAAGRQYGSVAAKNAFYTLDNKSFFKGDINHFVPFEHEGKQAFRCDVFQAGGKQFVGLVYRHLPNSRAELEPFLKNKVSDPDGSERKLLEFRIMQVKLASAPATGEWKVADETTIEGLRSSMRGPGGEPATLVTP